MPVYINLTLHGITARDPQDIFVPQDIEFSRPSDDRIRYSSDVTESAPVGRNDVRTDGSVSFSARFKGFRAERFNPEPGGPDWEDVTDEFGSVEDFFRRVRDGGYKLSNISAYSEFAGDYLTVDDISFSDGGPLESLNDLVVGPVKDFGA